MDIVNQKATDYANKLSSPDDALLQEIEKFTNLHHPHAHMLSGHLQGQFLQMLSCLLQPKYILEIGTFTGYSALCLAKGLQQNGELHTIELREEDATTARNYFSKSLYNNKINLYVGDAKQIIPALHKTWDMVFIDADKTGYIDYYELTLPHLKTNALLLADNVLFHGEVLEAEIKGKNAKAIQAFNERVASDVRVEQVMVTLRDGLLMIRKK